MYLLAALALGAVLVINEVMIRPASGGSEWVEIFNAGDAPATLAGGSLEDARRKPVKLPKTSGAIEPGGYRLVAASVPKVLAAFPNLDPSRVFALDGAWPTLNDSDGSQGFADLVILRDSTGTPADSLVYQAKWLGVAGVSLERVDARTSSQLASNWSPCVDDSLATPLRVNSLSLSPVEEEKGALLVPEEPVFGSLASEPPVIAWHLEEPAPVSLALFDLSGRPVRLLKPLEEGATVGRVVWDGEDDLGRPVPAGVYLVLLETRYGGDRGPRRWRKPLVVARGAE